MHWGLVRTIIVLVPPVETLGAVSLSNRSNGQVERQNAPGVSPWYGVYPKLDSMVVGLESGE